MGPDGHMLTFAVSHGDVLNVVAFRTQSEEWPDYQRLTRRAKREDALRDFAGYGANVTNLLKLTEEELDVVSVLNRVTVPKVHANQSTYLFHYSISISRKGSCAT